MADNYDYDLFVIGAGSAGVRAARTAAQHNAKVAVAEQFRLGGTCVIRGCVPKKLLVYTSQIPNSEKKTTAFGWKKQENIFDLKLFCQNKNKYIQKLENIYRKLLVEHKVDIFHSNAKIISQNQIFLENIQKYVTAKYIIIATGAKPFVPNIKGAQFAITSNEFFELEHKPESITIVGGGYIAVEFACIAAGIGIQTNLVYRGEKILKKFDADVSKHLTQYMEKKNIKLHLNNNIITIQKNEKHLVATMEKGKDILSHTIMFATGRIPDTSNIFDKNSQIDIFKNNHAIIVDDYYRTNIKNIYAIGDVINKVQLTPVAIKEAQIVAENIFANKQKKLDYQNIPTAVFSQPEIGVVGMTEEQAREKMDEIDIYIANFQPLAESFAQIDEKTMIKLIVERSSQKILGCHIVGKNSAEMIQIAAIAIKMGATKNDFDETMPVHPTTAEEMVTMKNKIR